MHAKIVYFLALKSLKSIWRQKQLRQLAMISILMVFGGLYSMWYFARGQTSKSLTSNSYSSLSFDMYCKPSKQAKKDFNTNIHRMGGDASRTLLESNTSFAPSLGEYDHDRLDRILSETTRTRGKKSSPPKQAIEYNGIHCEPIARQKNDENPADGDPLAAVLLNLIHNNGQLLGHEEDKNAETRRFVELLSSIMMNGLPLLGLDDYVRMSDFLNTNLGKNGKDKLLSNDVYRDRFSNFLNVRHNKLLFVPDTCLTNMFRSYLTNNTAAFDTIRSEVYPTIEQAMKAVRNEFKKGVWAVVELTHPLITPSSSEETCRAIFNANHDLAPPSPSPPKSSFPSSSSSAFTKEFSSPSTTPAATTAAAAASLAVLQPQVTIRMHPSSIPDTRNFEWTPMKHGRKRQQSGQLLYFVSGFLTLQLEIQNYFGYLHPGISSNNPLFR